MPEPAFEDRNPSSVAAEPYLAVLVVEETDDDRAVGNGHNPPTLGSLRTALAKLSPRA
jgi:hypothetical protein